MPNCIIFSINFQSYRRGPLVPHNSEVLKLLREQEGTGGLRSAAMGVTQEPVKEPQRPRTSSQGPNTPSQGSNTPSQGRHAPSQGQSAPSQGPQGDTRGQNNSKYSPFCCTLLFSPHRPEPNFPINTTENNVLINAQIVYFRHLLFLFN